MKTADVAIVGGGLIGIAAALQLRSRGLSVVVLDRQEPGREASSAAAGMLAPGPDDASSLPLTPLGTASIKRYPEFVAHIEQVSGKSTGFAQKGTLEVFFGTDGEKERDHFVTDRHRLGIAVEAIPIDQARQMEPGLSREAVAAAWLFEEAVVDPRLLIGAAVDAARKEGVDIRPNCAVTGLLRDDSRCTGVVTANEKISAGRVVIAAGYLSGDISVELARYAPTIPLRGQMLALRPRSGDVEPASPQHVLRSANGYLVPHEDGRVVAGSTLEKGETRKIVTPAGMRKILTAAIELAPALANAEIAETWAGLRPGTPDGLPILGPTDIDGLIIATGHYRNGILLAPITAQLVVVWALGLTPQMDVAAFSPMRFANTTQIAKEAQQASSG